MSLTLEGAAPRRHRALLAACAVALLAAIGLTMVGEAQAAKKRKPANVRVMTRNVYLGADLTPALAAQTPEQLVDAAGAILRQVDRTNFPVRAKALASEILKRNPDLVGLQEVALWRTQQPPDPNTPATFERYDFLELLMDQLNGYGVTRYRVVRVQQEFDAELPADYSPTQGTEGPGGFYGYDMDGRLTMRDVILKKVSKKVRTYGGQQGNYEHALTVPTALGPITVDRGYVTTNATVRGAKFHFVNTHLEAFDDETDHPSIRAQQAAELVAGPATGPRPVILVGDLNSDNPGVQPGDEQAYNVVRSAGFVNRDIRDPLTCCLSDPELTGGSLADFDHKVDHIMTNRGRKVKLRQGFAFGFSKVYGLYPSDHAGLASALTVKRPPRK